MPNKVFRVTNAINFLTQAVYTMICPAALFIGGGWLLRSKCGWGNWVMISGVVLGVIIGIFSFFRYITVISKQLDSKEGGKQN